MLSNRMPDKGYRSQIGKRCIGCWRNKFTQTNSNYQRRRKKKEGPDEDESKKRRRGGLSLDKTQEVHHLTISRYVTTRFPQNSWSEVCGFGEAEASILQQNKTKKNVLSRTRRLECGKENFKRRTSCFGCGKARSPGASNSGKKPKPGDWNCPGCGFLLFASKNKCFKCNTGSEMRDGDWSCPDCGKHKFAKNQFCRDCGHPREGERKEQEETEECVICMSNPKTVMLMHGNTGHTCCCGDCATMLVARGRTCPICRAAIERVVRNFTG